MKRKLAFFLKLAGVLLVLFLLALAAAPIVLKTCFPPEKVRALVVTQAAKSLKREVRLGGVSFGLLRGLTLKDLAVSEFPDFKAGTFAEMDSFSVKVRWLALLRKRIVVARVAAEGLKVEIVKRKNGLYNFSDLAGSSVPAKAGAAPAGQGLPLELAVSRAALSGGRIRYRDEGALDDVTVSGLDAKVVDFRLSGPFDAELAFKASGRVSGRPLDGGASFSGRLDLGGQDPRGASAEIKELSVDYSGLRARLEGSARGLKPCSLDVRASLSSKGAEVFSAQFAGTAGPPEPGAVLAAQGDFKAQTPGFNSSELASLGLPAGIKAPAAKIAGHMELKGEELALKAVKLESRGVAVDASGTVANFRSKEPNPDLELAAKVELPETKAADVPYAKLPAWLVIPAFSLDVRGHLKGDGASLGALHLATKFGALDASGSVAALRSAKPRPDLNVAAKLNLPEFRSEQLPALKLPAGLAVPAASVETRAALKGDDLALSALRIKTKFGTVDVSGSVRGLTSGKPTPGLDVAARLALPELKDSDIPFVKLPAGFVSPAASVEAKLRLAGDDLAIHALRVKTKAGSVDVSGTVAKLSSSRPEPSLDVTAKLDLPAFTSKDVPYRGVPADLAVPASKWDAAFSASLDAATIRSLRVIMGHNDVEVSGKAVGLSAKKPLFNVLVKCRSFALDELTKISPQTRDLNLAGRGFFALGFSAKNDKPIVQGKMQFKGLGATVAGLALSDFTGTASFDEKRIDVPNLKGKVADGVLNMDLTVKNYAAVPDIDLEASLTEFALGKFLAAKAAVTAPKAAGAGPGGEKKAPTPIDAKGKFAVGKLIHPNAEARDLNVTWRLTDITPDLGKLGGEAKFNVGGGKFSSIGNMATQSKVVKVLIYPFLIFQKIGSLGGVRLFPDFNNISFTELTGDYVFKDGVMTLNDTHLYSDAANIGTVGTIDLPREALDLNVTAQVANIAPMGIAVTGTFSQPKTKVLVGQFFKQFFQKEQ